MPETPEAVLSPTELAILQDFEQARLIQQMMQSQGWGLFLQLKDARIKELERQFWQSAPKMDANATWIAAMRKEAIVSFLNLWIAEIQQKVECLQPENMQRILETKSLADLDGD